ncbi:hypothetical protein [Bizionia sp.]|uniref:DUF7793 family protein n=1 Tax=Bizionia sp. TaxID=1954480 RepID=UPI003A9262D9
MNTPILDPSAKVTFWIENDILFCRFNQIDSYLSVANAKSYIAQIEEITNGKMMPCIIDVRKFIGNFSLTAAKIFTESSILKNITVHAFVADTLNGKLLISSYNRLYLKATYVHIFNNMEAALEFCIQSKNTLDANKN